MNIDYTLFSYIQLADAIDSMMERSERDETLRSELDAQLENICDALTDPSFRDYFGAIDAAIDSHIAVTDSMETRTELLGALMAEYGDRMAVAMAASRTFVGASHHYRNEGWIH
jgi:hypothetical protein